MAAQGGGVFAQVVKTSALFFSPDATHLTGGGKTRLLYDGRQGPAAFFPLRGASALIQLQKTGVVLQTTGKPGQLTQIYDAKAGPLHLTITASGGAVAQDQERRCPVPAPTSATWAAAATPARSTTARPAASTWSPSSPAAS